MREQSAATSLAALFPSWGRRPVPPPILLARLLSFFSEVTHERAAYLSGVSRDILEFQACAEVSGQAGGAASAGTDYGGGAAAGDGEEAAGGHERGAAAGARPGLGRRGDAERDAHPAGYAAGGCGTVPSARVADGGGRPDCEQCAGGGTEGRLRGSWRGRGADCRAGAGPGVGDGAGGVPGGGEAGDGDESSARPEPDQDAALLDHGGAVLAGVPFQLRVLRHYRDLRAAAAGEGYCAGAGGTGPVICRGMARGCVYRGR